MAIGMPMIGSKFCTYYVGTYGYTMECGEQDSCSWLAMFM